MNPCNVLLILSTISVANSIDSARFESFRSTILETILKEEVGITLSSSSNDPLDLLRPNDYPLLANLVRLAYHDCIGVNGNGIPICNGCIDLNKDDNSAFPTGSIDPIQDICDEYADDGISLADCWILAATFALELAAQNSQNAVGGDLGLHPGDIPYYYGRQDCLTSPQNENTFPPEKFADPFFYWEEIENFFKKLFPTWTNKEIVALIAGGHSLGRAHAKFSKFSGPWDFTPEGLDNRFFQTILNNDDAVDLDLTFYQGKLREDLNTQFFNKVSDEAVQQLNLPQSKLGLMFNSDLALAFDFSKFSNKNNREAIDCVTDAYSICPSGSVILIAENGQSKNKNDQNNICQYRQCPIQCPSKEVSLQDILTKRGGSISPKLQHKLNQMSPNSKCTAAYVLQYSLDNTLFVQDFVKIWTKLISSGYTDQNGNVNLNKFEAK